MILVVIHVSIPVGITGSVVLTPSLFYYAFANFLGYRMCNKWSGKVSITFVQLGRNLDLTYLTLGHCWLGSQVVYFCDSVA